jgi:hypothetical protein
VSLLPGCGDTSGDAALDSSPPPVATATAPASTLSNVTSTSEPQLTPVTEAAKADLSARLGVDPSMIEVVVAEGVTWPDGRLGCPELDLPYTLEPVEGYRVVLGYEGRLYHFHVGSDGIPTLCESLTKRGEGPGTPEPSIPPPIR